MAEDSTNFVEEDIITTTGKKGFYYTEKGEYIPIENLPEGVSYLTIGQKISYTSTIIDKKTRGINIKLIGDTLLMGKIKEIKDDHIIVNDLSEEEYSLYFKDNPKLEKATQGKLISFVINSSENGDLICLNGSLIHPKIKSTEEETYIGKIINWSRHKSNGVISINDHDILQVHQQKLPNGIDRLIPGSQITFQYMVYDDARGNKITNILSIQPGPDMLTGKCIKWSNSYGFITCDQIEEGKEHIYCHQSKICKSGFRKLQVGQFVKFIPILSMENGNIDAVFIFPYDTE